MTIGVPDLLTTQRLQRSNDSLSRLLETAAKEMSTGRKTDLVEASAGDLRRIYTLETRLSRLDTTADTLTLAESRATLTQETLKTLATLSGEIGIEMLSAIGRGDMLTARLSAGAARGAFTATVNSLNATFAGRSLFAGAATDSPALQSPEDMLADIQALVDASADSSAALTAIDDYFNDPAGGFATTAYTGSTQAAPATDLGDGNMSDYAIRADADEIRALLQGLAEAVMAVESVFSAQDTSVTVMVQAAGTNMINAQGGLTALRADLGVEEERIGNAITATAAESASLELVRTRLLAADPFETASNFQALEAQMQSVYAITGRLSALTLTDYLR